MKKKFGYTLAEVLIALGIVGFISALMLPVINKIKPDPVKTMFITTYDAITTATQELAANTGVYTIVDNDGDFQYDNAPLYNIDEVNIGGKMYGGDAAKYCEMLGLSFNTIGDMNCSPSTVTYSDSSFEGNVSFTGTNGIQYLVSTERKLTHSSSKYQSDIYFDVNGSEGKNCMYSSTCKQPDRFHLIVSADGAVFPADQVSAGYLKNRTDLAKRNITLGTAQTLPNGLLTLQPKPLTEDAGGQAKIACQVWKENGGACSGDIEVLQVNPTPAGYAIADNFCKNQGGRIPNLNELLSLANAAANDRDSWDPTMLSKVQAGTTFWTSNPIESPYTNNLHSVVKFNTSFNLTTSNLAGSKTNTYRTICVK